MVGIPRAWRGGIRRHYVLLAGPLAHTSRSGKTGTGTDEKRKRFIYKLHPTDAGTPTRAGCSPRWRGRGGDGGGWGCQIPGDDLQHGRTAILQDMVPY